MSSTNRGGARHERDFYRTPAWSVHRLLDALGDALGQVAHGPPIWFEPCVGDGAIVAAVDDWYAERYVDDWTPTWLLNDIAPQLPADVPCLKLDYAAAPLPESIRPRITIGITNPPFSYAAEVLANMRIDCKVTIVLQRLGWLGSAARAAYWQREKPSVFVLPDRPSFTADGQTDSADYAWYVFDPTDLLGIGTGILRVLDPTPAEIRRSGKVLLP